MAIIINKDGSETQGLIDDDLVQPFMLDKTQVRGRLVRLGPVLANIISQHKYPPPVAMLLSEVVTLCAMLSAMLKYDGIFTLQIKGTGSIRMLVADVTQRGEIRAYASYDEAAVKKAARRKQDKDNRYYHLLGTGGYLSFTVDHNGDVEHRYQGIVELKGTSLVDAVSHYLTQSEQIRTSFKVAIHPQDSQWRAGGIMIQSLPPEQGDVEQDPDAWNRAQTLLATCTEDELLSPLSHSADILYKLFHEDGVRVFTPKHVRHVCRCSRDKVRNILRSIPREELEETCEKEGQVSISCEFCGQNYLFVHQDLEGVYQDAPDTKN